MRSVQSKSEITVDSKNNQRSLTNAETEVGVRRDQDFQGRKQFGRRAWQSMLRRWCQYFPNQRNHGLQVEWREYYQAVRG